MCLFRKKQPFTQSMHEVWRSQWQELFPPECRNVPVTVDGVTHIAYVLVGHNAMMLQDGLLMQATFFDVCELFQKAGYHVMQAVGRLVRQGTSGNLEHLYFRCTGYENASRRRRWTFTVT